MKLMTQTTRHFVFFSYFQDLDSGFDEEFECPEPPKLLGVDNETHDTNNEMQVCVCGKTR